MSLELEGQGGSLRVGQIQAGQFKWSGVRLQCARLVLDSGAFACQQGQLFLPGQTAIAAELAQDQDEWQLTLRPGAEERWEFHYRQPEGLRLQLTKASPRLLQGLLPQMAPWQVDGRIDGHLNWQDGRLEGRLSLQQGRYSSQDGRQAAEGLVGNFRIAGRNSGQKMTLQGQLQWQAGALYSEPIYLQAQGQSLEFQATLSGQDWDIGQSVLNWPQVGTLRGEARGRAGQLQQFSIDTDVLPLAPLGDALLRPWLESRGLPAIQLGGHARMALEWRDAALQRLSFMPQNVSLQVAGDRFALQGLSGRLDWSQGVVGAGRLRVERLALGQLESSSFALPLAWEDKSLKLAEAVEIPLLDGALVLDHAQAHMGAEGDWEGALGLSVYPLSLERLTRTLGLPAMGGVLSASLPAIHYRRGEASLDGALVIQVFDGYLNCTNLRLIDPFGPNPRVLADVDGRHLDLGKLTETFSFGNVTGYVDAQLQGLEIASWQPVAFDARIVSSPGDYSRRISQRAVANISALGGGGAMAAVQSSVLRFFQDFGYRRLGLSCRLENGVCHMAGIPGQDQGSGYAIVEGGGIPALTVIGYNRAVHWDELVSRLKAAISHSAGPVIK